MLYKNILGLISVTFNPGISVHFFIHYNVFIVNKIILKYYLYFAALILAGRESCL